MQRKPMESTFSELNFNQVETLNFDKKKQLNLKLGNFSKIVDNKSKYDSSFLSAFLMDNVEADTANN